MLIPSWRATRPTLLILGLWLLSAAPTRATDPPVRAIDRDMYHTLLARKALLQDQLLAPLNLGVRVHDHVATLWGPVPSDDLMRRAVQTLRTVPDVLDVRNELHVEEPETPVPQYLPERLPPRETMPLTLPGLTRGEDSIWQGLLTRRFAETVNFAASAENVRLRPAAAGPSTTREAARAEEAVLPSILVPGSSGKPSESLEQTLNRLRLGERRFQRLQVELRGAHVHLSGVVTRWEDLHDFASVVAHLPGVDQVTLRQVHTEPGSR